MTSRVFFQIKDYEKLDSEEERLSRSRQIYDGYIMKELLSCSHVRAPSDPHCVTNALQVKYMQGHTKCTC